jgi:hypothetical protein
MFSLLRGGLCRFRVKRALSAAKLAKSGAGMIAVDAVDRDRAGVPSRLLGAWFTMKVGGPDFGSGAGVV